MGVMIWLMMRRLNTKNSRSGLPDAPRSEAADPHELSHWYRSGTVHSQSRVATTPGEARDDRHNDLGATDRASLQRSGNER